MAGLPTDHTRWPQPHSFTLYPFFLRISSSAEKDDYTAHAT